MTALERGLGRGLDSLLRSTREADIPSRDAKKLALTQLVPGPHQPRKRFDDSTLAELSTSIKNQGVVQPLIVRPKVDTSPQLYEIVAGERRWRAARLAGLTEVPVVICSYTDAEAMTVALVENLQREDLSPLEEAEALLSLRQAHNLSQEELAAKLGKSRSAVANALRLLQLPESVKNGLAAGRISAGHARALLAITDEVVQSLLFDAVVRMELSVRETEAAADHWKHGGKLPESVMAREGDEISPEVPDKKAAKRAPKPQRLKDLQQMLRQTVHHGASISGDEEKGRIALPYTTRGELDYLLNLLGMGDASSAEGEEAKKSGDREGWSGDASHA